MQDQTDIRDFCAEIQSSRDLFQTSDHKAKIAKCLKHFAAAGLTLATCGDARHLNRSMSTLQAYARDLSLRFPDYVPWALRTPEEKKRKKISA